MMPDLDPLDLEIADLEAQVREKEAEHSAIRSSISNCNNTLRNMDAELRAYNVRHGIVGPVTSALHEGGLQSVLEKAFDDPDKQDHRGFAAVTGTPGGR